MRIIKTKIIIFLLAVVLVLFSVYLFLITFSPIKDGLHLKYATTLYLAESQIVSEQDMLFSKIDEKYYRVDVASTGFLENQQKYIVDKHFIGKEGCSLSGPTAAVLWTAPYLLWIGNNVAAGEVIKFTKWHGYSAAVVQDPALANCYGFYDRKTGIQIGYINCFSANKLLTVIKEDNIKGLN